jgi:hypothetical protein
VTNNNKLITSSTQCKLNNKINLFQITPKEFNSKRLLSPNIRASTSPAMVSAAYTIDEYTDDYDDFWNEPNGFTNTHEQTTSQHFPANISASEAEPFPLYAAPPPNVTYHRGGYESHELSNQNLLEALQAQTAQFSMLMNQLPEHLRTQLTRPFAPPTSSIPDHSISGQRHLHSPPTRPFAPPSLPSFPDAAISSSPDLLNDENLLRHNPQTVSSRGKPTAFAPVSLICAPFHPGPKLFVLGGSQRSYQLSPLSHVTTPEGGNRVHLAKH